MRVLALDISSKTGWALLQNKEDGSPPSLVEFGLLELEKPIAAYGKYPFSYLRAAAEEAEMVLAKIRQTRPDVVVVEETNLGKNRYTQKFLEFLHCQVLDGIVSLLSPPSVYYISSSAWRSTLGLQMSKEDKKNNSKLSKAKRLAASSGKTLDKASLGIRGKINKKHLAVRYVNAQFGLKFKMKDNDIADAICLGTAYLSGASICDGEGTR